MRSIRIIMIHCTDTTEGREVAGEEVDQWHRQRGFAMAGYHYLIHLDGEIEHLRPLYMRGAACPKGNANAQGIHICYVGGRNNQGYTADTRTDLQRLALLGLLGRLKKQFPNAKICGHRDFDKGKACPCFDAQKEYEQLSAR